MKVNDKQVSYKMYNYDGNFLLSRKFTHCVVFGHEGSCGEFDTGESLSHLQKFILLFIVLKSAVFGSSLVKI